MKRIKTVSPSILQLTFYREHGKLWINYSSMLFGWCVSFSSESTLSFHIWNCLHGKKWTSLIPLLEWGLSHSTTSTKGVFKLMLFIRVAGVIWMVDRSYKRNGFRIRESAFLAFYLLTVTTFTPTPFNSMYYFFPAWKYALIEIKRTLVLLMVLI